MLRTLNILFSLILFSNCALAQETEPVSKYYWTISYFGEKLFHPGLQLSVNRSLFQSKDVGTPKNGFDIGLSTSNYFHRKNHVGFRLTPNLSFVHTTKNGFEYGLKADLGYMRRFYQGKVFEVDQNGNVKQKYFAGQNAFTYGAYFILSKNWCGKKSKNIRFFFEFGGFQETNYSEGSIFHPAVNMGVSKYFNVDKE